MANTFIALLPTAIIALMAIASATIAYRAAKIAAHNQMAQLLWPALEEYDRLGAKLQKVGAWSRDPETKRFLRDISDLYKSKNYGGIKNFSQSDIIDDADFWINEVRPIKQYFHSKYLMYKQGIIPRDVFMIMVNRYAYNMLHNVIFPLDVHRFFFIRPGQNIREEDIIEEFSWYVALLHILPAYTPRLHGLDWHRRA